MTKEIKQSKRGGPRKGAGRKSRSPEKPKAGRPFEYDADIFFAICERIAGGEFLAHICDSHGMPSQTTFRRWKNSSDELRLAYARAREDRIDAWADDMVMIADDGSRDYMASDDGALVPNQDHIQRSRLRIDTRKWIMSKHAPREYGDKTALELSGADGAPLVPVINVTIGSAEPAPAS